VTIKAEKLRAFIDAVKYFLQEELDRYGAYTNFLSMSEIELRLDIRNALEELEGDSK
jgi:hypothetical protein